MGALSRLGISGEARAARYSAAQEQTKDAFDFKWAKRDTYESLAAQASFQKWLRERYCDNDPSKLDQWLGKGGKLILDAGCGAGYTAILFFGDHLKTNDYLGVDISPAISVAKQRFKEKGYPGDFLQTSIMDLPFPDKSVDIIIAEGVLHHTDNTGSAMKYLASKLRTGGRMLFYVYAKKAVIREFSDDFVRDWLRNLTNEQAWEALLPLSKLGKALGELKIQIDVPEDIPYLGIKRGKQDIQRFFYWNIFKLFYRPDFSLDEMNHINFDWYRPLNCHRHTRQEIEAWCEEASLRIEHLNSQESGFTVVARRK
jgi:arsenite methyltransferase